MIACLISLNEFEAVHVLFSCRVGSKNVGGGDGSMNLYCFVNASAKLQAMNRFVQRNDNNAD